MAGSQETFGKKEREKKRLKKKKDKLLRKEERKAGGQESEFVYVDEFGRHFLEPLCYCLSKNNRHHKLPLVGYKY